MNMDDLLFVKTSAEFEIISSCAAMSSSLICGVITVRVYQIPNGAVSGVIPRCVIVVFLPVAVFY